MKLPPARSRIVLFTEIFYRVMREVAEVAEVVYVSRSHPIASERSIQPRFSRLRVSRIFVFAVFLCGAGLSERLQIAFRELLFDDLQYMASEQEPEGACACACLVPHSDLLRGTFVYNQWKCPQLANTSVHALNFKRIDATCGAPRDKTKSRQAT